MNSGVPAVLHSVSTLPSVAYTFIAELVAPIKYTVLDSASGRNGNVAVIVLVISVGKYASSDSEDPYFPPICLLRTAGSSASCSFL